MFHIIANWKMYLHHTEALQWCRKHGEALQDTLASKSEIRVGIAPEFCSIESIRSILDTDTIMVGAQSCSAHVRGAYTGDVSPQSLYDLGCAFCIVGHSERRAYYGETSSHVAQKVGQLISRGIPPIVCIGETRAEREAGQTQATLEAQLAPVCNLSAIRDTDIYVAYEPRWAIGTGTSARNSDIADALSRIREYMQSYQDTGRSILLYGGSVKPDNAREIAQLSQLDGFLVGSASRDFHSFSKIIHCI